MGSPDALEQLATMGRSPFGRRLLTTAIAETILVTGRFSFNYPGSPGVFRGVATEPLRDFGQGPPVSRDDRLGRRHRDLGSAPGYERGKGDADRCSMTIEGSTREQQPERATCALRSGRDPGIGRVETEMVRALGDVRHLGEFPGQDHEISGTASAGDATSQTPSGLGGQCSRDEEASPFEVVEWVHALRIYAPRWRTRVEGVLDYLGVSYPSPVPRVQDSWRQA
jgi:hypothetical protein